MATTSLHSSDYLMGEKTMLRPANQGFTLDELRRRFTWSHDAELQYWSGSIPSAKTFEEFQKLLPERDWPSDGRRQSYAILDTDGVLIGMVSCYSLDWAEGTGELGVYIGERERWGAGYGTDAVSTLLRHMFEELHFRHIHLNTYATNRRALRSYTKIGFSKTATRRRFRPSVGYYREIRMEMTRDRFAALHNFPRLGSVSDRGTPTMDPR